MGDIDAHNYVPDVGLLLDLPLVRNVIGLWLHQAKVKTGHNDVANGIEPSQGLLDALLPRVDRYFLVGIYDWRLETMPRRPRRYGLETDLGQDIMDSLQAHGVGGTRGTVWQRPNSLGIRPFYGWLWIADKVAMSYSPRPQALKGPANVRDLLHAYSDIEDFVEQCNQDMSEDNLNQSGEWNVHEGFKPIWKRWHEVNLVPFVVDLAQLPAQQREALNPSRFLNQVAPPVNPPQEAMVEAAVDEEAAVAPPAQKKQRRS